MRVRALTSRTQFDLFPELQVNFIHNFDFVKKYALDSPSETERQRSIEKLSISKSENYLRLTQGLVHLALFENPSEVETRNQQSLKLLQIFTTDKYNCFREQVSNILNNLFFDLKPDTLVHFIELLECIILK